MTTAPSTIMPMPIARPASDIRLAERPKRSIRKNAINMDKGSVTMTTSAERNSPRKRNSTTATRIEPSINARSAVDSALSTMSVRSYTGSIVTPAGSADRASASLLLTESTTFLAFS